MKPSLNRVRVVAACGILTLSLAFLSTLAAAAERPSNPAQLVLWLLSLNTQRGNGEPRKIDVNSATVEALTAVPGLDRRQAFRIIALRPYAKLQDLARAGLSPRFIERLEGLLTVGSPPALSASGAGPGVATGIRATAPSR